MPKKRVKNERVHYYEMKGATKEIDKNLDLIEARFPTLPYPFGVQLALSISKTSNMYGLLYNGQKEQIEKYGIEEYLNLIERTIHKMYKNGSFPRRQE